MSPFRVDGKRNVNRHHGTRIVVGTSAELLGQHVVVYFIDAVQRAFQIDYLIHPCVDFFLWIVVRDEELNLNGLSTVINFKAMVRRGNLC